MSDPNATRCAVIAIIGAPNAGKSTLVNRCVGQKIAIVTHKVQTTRAPVRGVAMAGRAQLIFIDTPGVFAPRRRLDRAMVRAAWSNALEADAIIHLVDAGAMHRNQGGADQRANEDCRRIVEGLKKENAQAILALNKVDSMPREGLLAIAQSLHGEGCYSDVFMISASKGAGVDDLIAHLVTIAPEGPWLYPEDQVADAPLRALAAEITREKLMLRLHDEIPYESMVETDTWQERKDGAVRIEQTIFVAREGQRKLAIGQASQSIKAIGEAARKEMEAAFDRRVHLFLHVKVSEGWSEDRARFTAMGLEWDE
jgi:GTP-binding protein Era